MDKLALRPMPSDDTADFAGYRRFQAQGFVDEAVVLSVIGKGVYERTYVKPEEMVLSSNEHDFAGWALPVASPFRQLLDIQAAPLPMAKSAAPPCLQSPNTDYEKGLDEPHRGSHRWWLFGLAGAMTSGLLSLTLLSLAGRTSLEAEMVDYIPIYHPAEPVHAALQEPSISPELSRLWAGEK